MKLVPIAKKLSLIDNKTCSIDDEPFRDPLRDPPRAARLVADRLRARSRGRRPPGRPRRGRGRGHDLTSSRAPSTASMRSLPAPPKRRSRRRRRDGRCPGRRGACPSSAALLLGLSSPTVADTGSRRPCLTAMAVVVGGRGSDHSALPCRKPSCSSCSGGWRPRRAPRDWVSREPAGRVAAGLLEAAEGRAAPGKLKPELQRDTAPPRTRRGRSAGHGHEVVAPAAELLVGAAEAPHEVGVVGALLLTSPEVPSWPPSSLTIAPADRRRRARRAC